MSALVPDLDGRSISSWSDIPTEWLHIEIQKRQDAPSKPACGSGKKGAYNVSLHVFALFLILVLSTLGKYGSHLSDPSATLMKTIQHVHSLS
ncbi:hypothetical protein MMC09_006858 [Bachmanniomyces sp. S44760]|nr:hypothetical protein [Bachmanniomyces sp. S44760]